MINVKQLKENLTINDIISLMSELDADYNSINDNEIHFKSICHKSNSYKLYYYIESQNFYCHRCAEQWDIFSLVQHIKKCNFVDALNFICDVLHIDSGTLMSCQQNVYNWQKDLGRYLKGRHYDYDDLRVYDDKILSFFDKKYHESWISEGISIESMKKYEIGWYERHNSIIIPCRDDNFNLIGCRERFIRPEDCESGKYRPLQMLDGTIYKFPTHSTFFGIYQNQEAIKRTKTVWLVEGEKSVIKFDSWFGDDNIALAMYGTNLGAYRRDYLVNLGVNEVVIMIDSDFHQYGDEEYNKFEQNVFKIAGQLKGFTKVSVCYNSQGYDGYKFAPCDFTKEQFDIMYNEREFVE